MGMPSGGSFITFEVGRLELMSTLISSCEGVQVGGLGSSFGILGSWTTIFHDLDDPVGEDRNSGFQCISSD